MGWAVPQIVAVTFQWAIQAAIQSGSATSDFIQEAQSFLMWSEQSKTIEFNYSFFSVIKPLQYKHKFHP